MTPDTEDPRDAERLDVYLTGLATGLSMAFTRDGMAQDQATAKVRRVVDSIAADADSCAFIMALIHDVVSGKTPPPWRRS